MNKKILIILAIVMIFAVVTSAIVIPKIKNKEDKAETGATNTSTVPGDNLKTGAEMLMVSTVNEITTCANDCGFTVTVNEDDDKISVNDVVCYGVPLQIDYFSGVNKTDLQQLAVYYVPFSDEYRNMESPKFSHSGGELKSEIEKFFGMIDSSFGVNVNGQYFIISNDGNLLDNKTDAAYDALISGNAVIDFTLRDRSGNYWILTSGLSEEGIVYFKFTNYFDLERYAENIAHITANSD